MLLFRILAPFVSGILYRMGGSDNPYLGVKFFNYRSMIGIAIGVPSAILLKSWIPLICILTYWFQPPYGDKSYLNFLGEKGKWAVCGFVFGASSTPFFVAIGHWYLGLVQGVISAVMYVVLKDLDDGVAPWVQKLIKIPLINKLRKNPWIERIRGFFGTILV